MVHIDMQSITLFSSGINCSMKLCTISSSLISRPIPVRSRFVVVLLSWGTLGHAGSAGWREVLTKRASCGATAVQRLQTSRRLLGAIFGQRTRRRVG